MKTKDKIRSDNKTLLEDLRAIRDNLSLEMKDMTLDQMRDFLKKKKTLHPKAVWNKVG